MTTRRSSGDGAPPVTARALWYAAAGRIELRTAPLPAPLPDQVRVRTLYSGISRGTERLVYSGKVGESEWQKMRAPLQEGDFPFPVKYGYCAVGRIEAGPADLVGRVGFCLHPHQDAFNAPAAMVAPVPDDVPPRRATLAANMETALNALWDAGAGPADRIVVIGAGIVGLLIAFLAARLPGATVTVIDPLPARAPLAAALGARFALPVETPGEADIVFHASATDAGLAAAIAAAGFEATIVEMSWYGDRTVAVPLGGAFHSRRLKLIASQVGQVAPARRPRWSYRRRIEAALALLADPALDRLVADEIAFLDAPRLLPDVFAASGLPPVIRYPAA